MPRSTRISQLAEPSLLRFPIEWLPFTEQAPSLVIAYTAATLYTPLERMDRPLLLVEDGAIVEVSSLVARPIPSTARAVDFGDATLTPGFIDIHIHGGAACDVMHADSAGMDSLQRFLMKHGVSSYFPTTVTAPLDVLLTALDGLAQRIESAAKRPGNSARPLGIHLEGPFISHARRGVHPASDLLKPTLPLFERLWQAGRGHIRVMTIAPELECAPDVIREASQRGVCVSLGHSDADLDSARVGLSAGAHHATHTFNAMRPIAHRDPGILGLVLTDQQMTADIIADGVHVHPSMVELFVRMKGCERTVLITDATAAAGMPDGQYHLGSQPVEVRDGKCLIGEKLAGSVLTMDRALHNLMNFAKLDFPQALRTATLNPATAVGISDHLGRLSPGADADIVVLSPEHQVIQTIVGGVSV